jgi:hypothetical protein
LPVLTGHCLNGREFRQELPAWLPADDDFGPDPATLDQATQSLRTELRSGGQTPILAPELLDNYPNPFRDQTRIRYRIPATIEEGFVWEEGKMPPVEPTSPIPYRSSQPAVSLKIYSISGHEIATLFTGALAVGQYEEIWDGCDAWGHPVASGAYFCKLQIENWAVTKRLVYLR